VAADPATLPRRRLLGGLGAAGALGATAVLGGLGGLGACAQAGVPTAATADSPPPANLSGRGASARTTAPTTTRSATRPTDTDAATPAPSPAPADAPAPAGAPADTLPWPDPQPLGDGLWLWPGSGGEADARNGGRTAHAAFIVGPDGVLVIDSGSAWRHGQALLQAVRRTTDRPLRGLWLSQARQEFVFGAAALQDAGVPVLMGRRAARLMAARCEGCLRALRREAGPWWMAGTRVVRPDRLLDDEPGQQASTGLPDIGRPLRLLRLGHASAPGDLVLHDPVSGWLLAGGVVEHRRIPDIQDADLAGWQTALQDLLRRSESGGSGGGGGGSDIGTERIRAIVPAHGPPGPAAPMLRAQQDYLSALDARARALARDGVALSAVADAATLAAQADWDQADTIHRRNASILFLRHERALLRE
jgi:glyoxylase-like metal-dependent hydrolase (beta-lactamase superfamily II)